MLPWKNLREFTLIDRRCSRPRSGNLGPTIENPAVADDQQSNGLGHRGIRRQSGRELGSDAGRVAQNKAN